MECNVNNTILHPILFSRLQAVGPPGKLIFITENALHCVICTDSGINFSWKYLAKSKWNYIGCLFVTWNYIEIRFVIIWVEKENNSCKDDLKSPVFIYVSIMHLTDFQLDIVAHKEAVKSLYQILFLSSKTIC